MIPATTLLLQHLDVVALSGYKPRLHRGGLGRVFGPLACGGIIADGCDDDGIRRVFIRAELQLPCIVRGQEELVIAAHRGHDEAACPGSIGIRHVHGCLQGCQRGECIRPAWIFCVAGQIRDEHTIPNVLEHFTLHRGRRDHVGIDQGQHHGGSG